MAVCTAQSAAGCLESFLRVFGLMWAVSVAENSIRQQGEVGTSCQSRSRPALRRAPSRALGNALRRTLGNALRRALGKGLGRTLG